MSRLWMLACVCVCALTLTATPAFAKQRADQIKEQSNPPEILLAALEQKVEIDGDKVGELTLTEGLQALAKKHNVTFVILDEEFKAKKISAIKGRKSRVQKLDAKNMTVAEFLDVWLPGLRATYKIHPDYVAVVPLPQKTPEPAPVLKLRKQEPDAKDQPKQPAAKKGDAAAAIIAALEGEVQLKEGSNINDIPLFELLQDLSKKHNVTFSILEEYFKSDGGQPIKERKPNIATTQLRGLQLQQFLRVTLDSMGATYLIRNNSIEIVPTMHAAKVTKSGYSQDAEGRVRLDEPLVSAIFKETPLRDAVAAVAEKYDLTVVVSPQSGDGRAGPVSARLLNVPADKALELLALQADLRVVRRGAAYLITSKAHAIELYTEKTDKERERIELDKLRQAPAKPADKPAGALPGVADPLWYFRNLPHYDGFHVPFGGGVPITPGQPPVPAVPAPKPKK